MKRAIVMSFLMILASAACGAEDDAPEPAAASAVVSAVEAATELSPPDEVATSSEALSLAGGQQCTPERRYACDACVAGCDGICAQPGGGGTAGCVGLFCPSRCDTCKLGCYRACGKCPISF